MKEEEEEAFHCPPDHLFGGLDIQPKVLMQAIQYSKRLGERNRVDNKRNKYTERSKHQHFSSRGFLS
jgi:hypothetical protein